jgi:hypothetical protein
MEGPRKHQAGEKRARRQTASSSARLRGANVQASRPARKANGTPLQRNRGFNPLGSGRSAAPDGAKGRRADVQLEGTDRRAR